MNDIQYVRQHYPTAKINRYSGDFFVIEAVGKCLGGARSDSAALGKAREEVERELMEKIRCQPNI